MYNINPSQTVCFTGPLPRNLYGYDSNAYSPILHELKNIIIKLHEHEGFTNFITGGAQGIDQLAFWAVNQIKTDHHLPLQNIVFLPFTNFNKRWKKTGLFSKSEFNTLLLHADQQYYISSQENAASYLARNRAMVDSSTIIIGVYPNDEWTNGDRTDPGTAYTLKYGVQQNKHVIVLNPYTLTWKTSM